MTLETDETITTYDMYNLMIDIEQSEQIKAWLFQ